MARLDRLAPVKEVAQIGAVIGREFSYEVLAAVAHRPAEQLREALDQLVGAGLIFRRGTAPEATFIFKHARAGCGLQHAVARSASGAAFRHCQGSRRAGRAGVRERGSCRGACGAPRSSLARGRGVGKALNSTLNAARAGGALYARPEAISRYWQALELFERLPGNVERNRVHADVDPVAHFIAG